MPGDPCFTAKSGLSQSASCNDHVPSTFGNSCDPESPINTPTSDAEYGVAANTDSAVPLLQAGNVEPKKYINANVVPLDDGGKQFLGATVSRRAPAAPQQLISLFKAAHDLKLDIKGDDPAEIVQFISPCAFYNPGKSNDHPVSGLLKSGQFIEGVGQLISCEKFSESRGSNPPMRKFTVTYSDTAGKEQTLVLTEIAPDFRKSLMTADSIKDTVAQLDGKSSEGMLSKQGVGRVAIMHVALEVKRAIDQGNDPSSLNEEWVTQQVDVAIKKLEQHRPKYLSKNNDQKNHLITYLVDVAKARASTTSRSDEPNSVNPNVEPKTPLDEEPIQPDAKSVDSSRENVGVETQPGIKVADVVPEPVAPTRGHVEVKPCPIVEDTKVASSPVDSNVESKPTFIKNAATLGFIGIRNSCYMNSALKFLMLTQGEALIHRIDSAIELLQKKKQLAKDVSTILQCGSGRVDESKIEQAVGLVSLDTIMIETEGYKNKEASKRKAQAAFIAPLRQFVERYMASTPASERSDESFRYKLSQGNLGAALENEKDELVKRSKDIYDSIFRFDEGKRSSPKNLADKLINHVNDLDCFKSESSVKALDEYKNEFAGMCNAVLKNVLKGERLASKDQLKLAGKVQKQLESRAKEIPKKVEQLESLKKFFIEQPIDSAALEDKLKCVRSVFEDVCFLPKDKGRQQDPIELFEKCQDVFDAPVFFEHRHSSGETKLNKNQVQVKFYDIDRQPQTLSGFGGLLTEFNPTDLFDHDELYVAIRYQGKHQFFKQLDLDRPFNVQTSDGKKDFQADSLIFHTGVETRYGHYFMIHRDENGNWTEHNDESVLSGLSIRALAPSPQNPYRPVMIRLKKV